MSVKNEGIRSTRQVVQMPWYLEHGEETHNFPPRRLLQYNLMGVSYGNDFFLRTQRTMLIGPLRYLQRVRKAYRNFSGGTRKNVSAQNMKFCQNVPTHFELNFFNISTFFTFPYI